MYPVCTNCQIEFMKVDTGITLIEMFQQEPPVPYKLWSCDLFECPVCNQRITSGYAQHPFAQHFEPDFNLSLEIALQGEVVFSYEKPVLSIDKELQIQILKGGDKNGKETGED